MLLRRPLFVLLAVPLAIVFVLVSLVVARWLSTENHERDELYTLVRAEAAHDAPGVLRQLHGCDAACAVKVRAVVAGIPRGTDVKIVLLNSGTAYTFGVAEGVSRLVWVPSPTARPVVQCVRVRRQGGPVSARSVSLLTLGAPLADNESSC